MVVKQKNKTLMKRIKFILLIALTSLLGLGVQDKPDYEDISVAINSRNYLYVGYENPVRFAFAGIPFHELSFTCTNGKVRTVNGLKITPTNEGNVDLKVYKGSALVTTIKFYAVNVPAPEARVSGQTSGTISASMLQATKRVYLQSSENESVGYAVRFPYNELFKITSFTISTAAQGGYTLDKTSESNKLTSEQRQLLSNIRKGQKVYFSEIMAESITGKKYKLKSIMFKVQ